MANSSKDHASHEEKNLKKFVKDELSNDECVGTLLVHKNDMEKLSKSDGNLQRRVTEKIDQLPPPSDEDVQYSRIARQP